MKGGEQKWQQEQENLHAVLCVVGLAGLVERQSVFAACRLFFGEVWSFEIFRFPFNGLVEISRFGKGGS